MELVVTGQAEGSEFLEVLKGFEGKAGNVGLGQVLNRLAGALVTGEGLNPRLPTKNWFIRLLRPGLAKKVDMLIL
jgi:hypothetical protein